MARKTKAENYYATTLTAIQSWCKSVVDSQAVGHTLAVRALTHASQHGDVSLMQALVDGLRDRGDGKKHVYVTGLTRWMREYSPVKIKPNGNWGLKREDEEGYRPFDIENATKNPFWSLVPEGKTDLTLAQVIKLVTQTPLTRLENAHEEGKFKGTEAEFAKLKVAIKAAAKAFENTMGADGVIKVNADLAVDTDLKVANG